AAAADVPLGLFHRLFVAGGGLRGAPFAGDGLVPLKVRGEGLGRLLLPPFHPNRPSQPALLLLGLVCEGVTEGAAPAVAPAGAGHLEALGSTPAGLDLGHWLSSLYFATSIIDMLRPSRRGVWSTVATSATFSAILSSIARPSSGWVIERPRKNTDTFTLWPSP